MNVKLLKYHVLRCPKCGHLKSSTARCKTRCVSCMHGWDIHRAGNTWGVLASFYTPQQSSEYIQNYKMKIAKAEARNSEIQTAFSLLGLRENCTREAFVSEYRKRAYLYHPDMNSNNPVAEQQFKEVTFAAQQIRSAMGWQ